MVLNLNLMKPDVKIIIGHYIILLAILVSWVNIDMVSPPMSIRILYTILFFAPLLFYSQAIPALVTVFFTVRVNSVAPFGYLPTESLLYLIFLIIAGIFTRNQNSLFKDENRIDRIWIAFILYSTVVTLINLSDKFAFFKYTLIISLLYYFVKSKFSLSLYFASFIVYSLILSIYSYFFSITFELVQYNSFFEEISRSYWTDPNYLGATIGIGTVLSFVYISRLYRPFNSVYMDILSVFTFVASLYTLLQLSSRGALISTAIACILALFMSKVSFLKKTFVTILLLFAAFVFFKMGFFDAILMRISDDSGGSGRMIIWYTGLMNYLDQNIFAIVLGGGSDWSLVLCRKGPLDWSPHNNFLQILFDYGIVGLIMFLIILYRLIAYSKYKRMSFICILYTVLTCMTVCPFQFACFPLFLGFCMCLTKIDRHNS